MFSHYPCFSVQIDAEESLSSSNSRSFTVEDELRQVVETHEQEQREFAQIVRHLELVKQENQAMSEERSQLNKRVHEVRSQHHLYCMCVCD